MIMIVLTVFSLIIGQNLFSGIVNITVDNEALIDGVPTTFVIESQEVLFFIDTSSILIAGIALLTTVIIVASITGITVIGTGLSSQSAKIIILIVAYGGIWGVLSVLSANLIFQIEVFGTIIYITLTIAYSIGVVKKLTGGSD